jgi:hypothetical protein
MLDAQIPVPIFQGLRATTSVAGGATTGDYQYVYSIYNPPGNTIPLSTLKIDIQGDMRGDAQAMAISSPYKWTGIWRNDHGAVIWGRGKNTPDVLPGSSITGYGVLSHSPPLIANLQLQPLAGDYIRQVIQQRYLDHLPWTTIEEEAIKARYIINLSVLAPAPQYEPTFSHYDRWLSNTVQAGTLGWISDPALLNGIKNLQNEARQAAQALDGFTVRAKLQTIIDRIQTSGPGQRTQEGHALVYFNALFLMNSALYPCEPVLTLTPDSATYPIGAVHDAMATLINRVDGLPVANHSLIYFITDGPNQYVFQSGSTDENGIIRFSYSSSAVGTDHLIVYFFRPEELPSDLVIPKSASPRPKAVVKNRPAATRNGRRSATPSPACNGTFSIRSAPSTITWTAGPDLVVSSFIPPVLKSGPGKTFYITEDTENRGKLAALQTITRYYLSATETIDLASARIISQRTVPPLVPGATNSVTQVPFTFPSDLPDGVYYITACADDDKEVLETNEDNNCAHNFLEGKTIRPVEVDETQPPVANNQSVAVNQGSSIAITLTAHDNDNDPLTFIVASPPAHGALTGNPPNLIYAPSVGYSGPDSFTFKANDGRGDSNIAMVSITVRQTNHPPDCTRASNPSLWPPSHKFISVAVQNVTDPDGDPVTLTITSVKQDEPVRSPGSGNFSPDATLLPLKVRSEREGGGNGRVYHIGFTASDNKGGICAGVLTVCVPHDQGQGKVCGDEGLLHDSTVP